MHSIIEWRFAVLRTTTPINLSRSHCIDVLTLRAMAFASKILNLLVVFGEILRSAKMIEGSIGCFCWSSTVTLLQLD